MKAISISLTDEQYDHLMSIAQYYEQDDAGMIEMILSDQLYEISKCIDENGVYEPM